MLKTVRVSSNSKVGPIATTYRAGEHSTYATCPATCALNPHGDQATGLIDPHYMGAVYDAVPPEGEAWTYSHFAAHLLPRPAPGKTTINFSADTMDQAVDAVALGVPATVAAPAGTVWPYVHRGITFLQCPEQTSPADSGFTCASCGHGRPLCARGDRAFVIVFVAHGTGAKHVATDTPAGCYAQQGHVAIAWHGARKTGAQNDARAILDFAKSLPAGSFLRHHIAGDFGLSS